MRRYLLGLCAVAAYVFLILHLARLQDSEYKHELREIRTLVEQMNAVDAVQR